MANSFQFPLILCFAALLLSPLDCTPTSPYSFQLMDSSGNVIEILNNYDVIDISLLPSIQVGLLDQEYASLSYIYGGNFTYQGAIPGYLPAHYGINSPIPMYANGTATDPTPVNLNLSKMFSSYGLFVYSATVFGVNGTGNYTFYAAPNATWLCSWTQSAVPIANGLKCYNGGVCVGQKVGNTCNCLAHYAEPNCTQCVSGYNIAIDCTDCLSELYGPNCTECPACSSHGICNSTKSGNGLCICEPGWTGVLCQSCEEGYYGSGCSLCPNCSDYNTMCSAGLEGSGDCVCNTGFAGDNCTECDIGFDNATDCATCLSDYYGYSCELCPDCGLYGVCNETREGNGACICETGWNGTSCSDCAENYFGEFCNQTCQCGIHGICSQGITGNGSCTCLSRWTGTTCDECAVPFTGATCSNCLSDYYGYNCEPCPDCGLYGVCSQGVNGTGLCKCLYGWIGELCDVCPSNFDDSSNCTNCTSFYYGPNCTACTCDNGMCNDGIAGNGMCQCDPYFDGETCDQCQPDHFGIFCQYLCPTCEANAHCDNGTSGTGDCICNEGFYGADCISCSPGFDPNATCLECLPDYYGSDCQLCIDCGTHGVCSQGLSGNGECICDQGWSGTTCDECASGYDPEKACSNCQNLRYGLNCTPCVNCGPHGNCEQGVTGNGSCKCHTGWTNISPTQHCDICLPNYYGSDCLLCPNCSVNGPCSETLTGSGDCVCEGHWGGTLCNECVFGFDISSDCSECLPDYYGFNCSLCPSCVNGNCNATLKGNGKCECETNWGGPLCSVCINGFDISSNCTECLPGYYGSNCTQCPDCVNGVCEDGLTGSGMCNCSVDYTGHLCDACFPDHYGESCSLCQICEENSRCDAGINGTGDCVCFEGFVGVNCSVCASGFNPNTSCTECLEGYYGWDCLSCPLCEEGHCDEGRNGTGLCDCDQGWAGTLCTYCAPGFSNSSNCTECMAGYYGNTCDLCPNCDMGTCDEGINGNGLCSCKLGWGDALCDSCANNYYGENCTACPTCGSDGACDQGLTGSGTCICNLGWAGDQCNECATNFQGTDCNQCVTGYLLPQCRTCTAGFGGTNCTECDGGTYPNCYINVGCPDDCSGHGVCNNQIGVCTCNSNYAGLNCNNCSAGYSEPDNGCWKILPCPDPTCSGNGVCNQQLGICQCSGNFTGTDCATNANTKAPTINKVGIGVGVVFAVLAVIAIAGVSYYLYRRHQKKKLLGDGSTVELAGGKTLRRESSIY